MAVASLAMALAVAVGSCEMALRIYVAARGWTPNCYAASLELFVPDTDAGYTLARNFFLRSGVYTLSTNEQGFRGPPVALAKPAGTVRIALLGESSAFGYFVNDGEEAARILERALRDAGEHVEVINAAVPGYNLHQTIRRFDTLAAPLEPDLVILYAGWNDLVYVVSPTPGEETFRRRPIAPSWERPLGRSVLYGFVAYRCLGGEVRLAPAQIESATPTTEGSRAFRENLRTLAARVRQTGARFVICAQATAAQSDASPELRRLLTHRPELVDAMVVLGDWLRQTLAGAAREEGAIFLDANEAIAPDESELADYVHLTATGEAKLAQFLARHIGPELHRDAEVEHGGR